MVGFTCVSRVPLLSYKAPSTTSLISTALINETMDERKSKTHQELPSCLTQSIYERLLPRVDPLIGDTNISDGRQA